MSKNFLKLSLALGILGMIGGMSALPCAYAADASPKAAPATAGKPDESEAQQVNIENIKEKYWARGDQSELGVVQNRLYTKAHKFELGLLGGFVSSDPFVTTYDLGGTFGYHLSEYFSLHAVGWKSMSSVNGAFQTYQDSIQLNLGGTPASSNSNFPRWYAGGEAMASVLYGKLSLIGKAIIYYDMHFLAGFGVTGIDNNNGISQTPFTEHAGIGQQIYVSKKTSIRLDYRIMHYTETQYNSQSPSQPVIGTRSNWTHTITLGVDFLIGGGAK